jgi:nucleotide-binding universal stress UspA family protein
MTNNENYEPTLSGDHKAGEIVVGVDDGPAAAAAVRWAAQQSRLVGMPLCVVHAWQLGAFESAALTAGSGTAELLQAARADARARATQWVNDALGPEGNKLRWRLEVVEDAAGPALVAESRGAHLLVIGTKEHTGLRRAVLGSVSHYCVSHAEVPVVAVSATQASPPSPRKERVDHDMFATPGPLL